MTAPKAEGLDTKRLRELLEKATPGPWAWEQVGEKSNGYVVGVAVDSDGEPVAGEIRDDHHEDPDCAEMVERLLEIGGYDAATVNYIDPCLIVEVINNLPQLLDIADAAQEVAGEMESESRLHKSLHAYGPARQIDYWAARLRGQKGTESDE